MKYFLFIILISSCSFFNKNDKYSNFYFSDKERSELIKNDNILILHFYEKNNKKSFLSFHDKKSKIKVIRLSIKENIDWYKFYRNSMFVMKKMPTVNYQLTAVVRPDLKPLYVSDVWNESVYDKVLTNLIRFWKTKREETVSKTNELFDRVNFFPVNKVKDYEINIKMFDNTFASLVNKKDLNYNDLLFLINFSHLTNNPSFSKKSRELIMSNYKKILNEKNINSFDKVILLEKLEQRFKEKFNHDLNLKKDTFAYYYFQNNRKKILFKIKGIIEKDYFGNSLIKNGKLYSLEDTVSLLDKLYYSYKKTFNRYYLTKFLFILKFVEREYWSKNWHMPQEKTKYWQVAPYFEELKNNSIKASYYGLISCMINKDQKCFAKYNNLIKLAIVRSLKNPSETTSVYSILFLKHNEFDLNFVKSDEDVIKIVNNFFIQPNIIVDSYFNKNKSEHCTMNNSIVCQKYESESTQEILKKVFKKNRL